jgi:hypothetical protein
MKTKETIRKLLIKTPYLRDSDNKLIATIWFKEIEAKELDPNTISAYDFLKLYAASAVSNAETIRRMRAKLQEECPELRGEVYNLRKGIIQDKWRNDLGYENNK